MKPAGANPNAGTSPELIFGSELRGGDSNPSAAVPPRRPTGDEQDERGTSRARGTSVGLSRAGVGLAKD